jgi:formate C-acetyltransferase
VAPLPLLSALTEGPLESGRDVTQDGMLYNVHSPLLAGLSHTADALAAIKKLCFEDKTIGWAEMLDTIRNNWREKESLRKLVLSRSPAYGNDLDYADEIATEIVAFYVERIKHYEAQVKNKKILYYPGLGTFGYYRCLGELTGAGADGRMEMQWASSNATPSIGRTENGPTAAVASYCKLPLVDLPCGAPLDIALENRSSLLPHLEAFIKTFVQNRGQMLALTVNDCDKLRAAQIEPDKYRDLQIRIGGWNVYFTDLAPVMQEWQIAKCEMYT